MGPHHPPDRVATVGNSANLRSFGWQPVPVCQQGGGHTLAAFTAAHQSGYGHRRGVAPPTAALLLSSDLSLIFITAEKVRYSRVCR